MSEYSLSYRQRVVSPTSPTSPASSASGAAAGTSSRASSLPADERRAAIAEATLTLLFEHGPAVSTRQIAEAAGIAEGTIFRVFPDKASVVHAAVELALDPGPITAAIAAIDLALPLEDRLVEAVELLQGRTRRIVQLMAIVEALETGDGPARHPRKPPHDLDGLASLFEPDADDLRRSPAVAAQLLRAVTIGGTHPMFAPDGPMSAGEIVSLVLDGIRTSHPTDTDSSC